MSFISTTVYSIYCILHVRRLVTPVHVIVISGQACSTLLSLSEEGQSYKDFHSAVIKLLMVGSQQQHKDRSGDSHRSVTADGAVVKHSFSLAWRILDCLPPSVEFFKNLLQDLEMQHLQVTVSRTL